MFGFTRLDILGEGLGSRQSDLEMVLELGEGMLAGRQGTVKFPPEFNEG